MAEPIVNIEGIVEGQNEGEAMNISRGRKIEGGEEDSSSKKKEKKSKEKVKEKVEKGKKRGEKRKKIEVDDDLIIEDEIDEEMNNDDMEEEEENLDKEEEEEINKTFKSWSSRRKNKEKEVSSVDTYHGRGDWYGEGGRCGASTDRKPAKRSRAHKGDMTNELDEEVSLLELFSDVDWMYK